MNRARYDSIPFEVAQLLNQHLLSDARDRPLQLGKTKSASIEEMKDDYHLPPAFQHSECLFDTRGRHVWRHVT
jgi:hypothetical protein